MYQSNRACTRTRNETTETSETTETKPSKRPKRAKINEKGKKIRP